MPQLCREKYICTLLIDCESKHRLGIFVTGWELEGVRYHICGAVLEILRKNQEETKAIMVELLYQAQDNLRHKVN